MAEGQSTGGWTSKLKKGVGKICCALGYDKLLIAFGSVMFVGYSVKARPQSLALTFVGRVMRWVSQLPAWVIFRVVADDYVRFPLFCRKAS